uniref:Protein prune homolog n=1 Tax=Phallusia mammillata TaxID=59560 RepID=A0A6F9DP44_9ASCI|nr:protein prune homolog [Phallusia mammillata]
MEVNQYLLKTNDSYRALKNAGIEKEYVHLVIGNESGDLDSFVSALTLAWFKHKVGKESSVYIPVMNICRKDLKLRTEISFMVAKIGINVDSLLFQNEVDWDFLTSFKQNFKVTLVDHNSLPRKLSFLEPHVVEIVDHHPVVTEIRPNISQNIKTIGSCSTLIAMETVKNVESAMIPDEIKLMLLSAILIDTCNFDPNVGKTTPEDVEVFEKLKAGKNADEVTEYYNQLNNAKFDVEGLTTTDIMLKDPKYLEKDSHKSLFSTIHQTSDTFFQRDNVAETISEFCKANNYTAWISLLPTTRDRTNKPYKPITIHTTDTRLRDEITSKLCASELLEVTVVSADELPFTREDFVFLRMYNCKASRKQVLPVVQRVWQTYH